VKEKTIVQEHCANFETLQRAFAEDNVCIMDCVEKATNEHVQELKILNKKIKG
jgi:acetylglutamate synthase